MKRYENVVKDPKWILQRVRKEGVGKMEFSSRANSMQFPILRRFRLLFLINNT